MQQSRLLWDALVRALGGKLEAGPGLEPGKSRGEGRRGLEDE